MKKIISFIAAAVMIVNAQPMSALDAQCSDIPQISAKAAVLISADTGEIVFEKNSDEKLPMASTTKIMTTLLCLESGNLDEEFVVDSEAIKVEGSSMGLQEGDIVTKYALCCGMLLPSGNDAANVTAIKLAGSMEAFADLMNERACEMGLSRTFFVTPSGLEGDGHGSSAYDMAILAREALRNPVFREICSQSSIQTEFGNPPYKRWLKNTNKLLNMYDGVYGVKTGFTDEAGRCLVSACERNGENLICVTLNDRNDWADHSALYDYGFEKVSCVDLEIPEIPPLDIAGSVSEKLSVTVGEGSIPITSCGLDLDEIEYTVISAPFVYAPVCEGDEIGYLRFCFKGREVCSIPLFAAENADFSHKSEDNKSKNKFVEFIKRLGKFFS